MWHRTGLWSGEHHFCGFNFRQGSKLVAEEHTPVGKLAAHFIGHRQDLPVELLDDEGYHKKRVGILLRHNEKHGALLPAEPFRVNFRIEAENLRNPERHSAGTEPWT